MAQWRRGGGNEVFSSGEIEARLKDELPQWYLEDGWIRRKYKTSGWKATLMVVNTVGHLAEAAWHHPDLTVSYAFVTVKLQNHEAKGHHREGLRAGEEDRGGADVAAGQGRGRGAAGAPDDPRELRLPEKPPPSRVPDAGVEPTLALSPIGTTRRRTTLHAPSGAAAERASTVTRAGPYVQADR